MRDQSDLRKRHIHFWKKKYNGGDGGNKDVAALPIERRACPCAIEAILFPTQKEFPKAALYQCTEHLKTAGQL